MEIQEAPKTKELSGEQSLEIQKAKVLEVGSQEKLENAVDMIKGFKALKKKINETFDPHIKRAFGSHRNLVAEKKGFIKPLEDTESLLKYKMNRYLDQVEIERKKEEAKLAEVARKNQQKLIDRANIKVERLLEKSKGTEEQLISLNNSLNSPNLSIEEDKAINSQILLLEAKIRNSSKAIEEEQIKVEESEDIPLPVIAVSSLKVSGMSSRTEIVPTEIRNSLSVLKWVTDTGNTSIIKWDMGKIKRLLNMGFVIPGVASEKKRVTSLR